LGGRFDLVTVFACPFNYLELEHRLWTIAEWSFFCGLTGSGSVRVFDPLR